MTGSSKGAGNRCSIGLDLVLERLEVLVSGVDSYFPGCSIIEVYLFVVDGFYCGGYGGLHVDRYF